MIPIQMSQCHLPRPVWPQFNVSQWVCLATATFPSPKVTVDDASAPFGGKFLCVLSCIFVVKFWSFCTFVTPCIVTSSQKKKKKNVQSTHRISMPLTNHRNSLRITFRNASVECAFLIPLLSRSDSGSRIYPWTLGTGLAVTLGNINNICAKPPFSLCSSAKAAHTLRRGGGGQIKRRLYLRLARSRARWGLPFGLRTA